MNLAWKDVRRQLPKFVLTGVGLGLLFAVVLAMGGIYRGMVEEATLLVDRLGADLWIVQRDTRGPFAERSVLPPTLEDRARGVTGVAWSRSFSTTTIQREHLGKTLRMTLVGLAWPDDRGSWLPLVEGRALESAHRELVVDRTLGLALGERVLLGDETYTVVGTTKGLVGTAGDGLVFATASDFQRIQGYVPSEAVRLEREGRVDRLASSDLSRLGLGPRVRDDRASLPVLAPPAVNAILVHVADGQRPDTVAARFSHWQDVTVFTTEQQRELLLYGLIDKSRKQIGLFRAILAVVSAIVVTLVLYNMTVAKTREIALLKLMGARTRVVVGMILQQSIMLGAIGYAFALALGSFAFQHFPRKVSVTSVELAGVAVLVLAISIVASVAGIVRALRISPTSILSS